MIGLNTHNDIFEKNSRKCLIWGVLTYFGTNVPFWGPYLSSKHFSYPPLNLSRQGAFFKHPYDYFLSDDFMTKKSGKIGRNSKIFVKIVLITHFYLAVHILIV